MKRTQLEDFELFFAVFDPKRVKVENGVRVFHVQKHKASWKFPADSKEKQGKTGETLRDISVGFMRDLHRFV